MNRNALHVLLFFLTLFATVAVSELNYYLGPSNLRLHAEVLWILFSGFYLAPLPGLLMTSVLAGLLGSVGPFPISLQLTLLLGLWLSALLARRRIRRENYVHLAGFAAGAQAVSIFLLGLYLGRPTAWTWAGYSSRLLADALVSALFVALTAGLWTHFQRKLLASFGWSLENEVNHS